jgi:hypothetical protein
MKIAERKGMWMQTSIEYIHNFISNNS